MGIRTGLRMGVQMGMMVMAGMMAGMMAVTFIKSTRPGRLPTPIKRIPRHHAGSAIPGMPGLPPTVRSVPATHPPRQSPGTRTEKKHRISPLLVKASSAMHSRAFRGLAQTQLRLPGTRRVPATHSHMFPQLQPPRAKRREGGRRCRSIPPFPVTGSSHYPIQPRRMFLDLLLNPVNITSLPNPNLNRGPFITSRTLPLLSCKADT